MLRSNLQVLSTNQVFQFGFFQGLKIQFTSTRFDGTQSPVQDHFVLKRGDSVGILMHDATTDEVILVEQLRIATVPVTNGWILEIPAGRLEEGEDPVSCACREIHEETGALATDLKLISSFFLSPGGCSERIHLFYFLLPPQCQILVQAGLDQENEDIRIHRLPITDALAKIQSGSIIDAKTILALFWLQQSKQGNNPY